MCLLTVYRFVSALNLSLSFNDIECPSLEVTLLSFPMTLMRIASLIVTDHQNEQLSVDLIHRGGVKWPIETFLEAIMC